MRPDHPRLGDPSPEPRNVGEPGPECPQCGAEVEVDAWDVLVCAAGCGWSSGPPEPPEDRMEDD